MKVRMNLSLPSLILGSLTLFSLLFFLALIPVPRADGQLIGSDGVGYYVYLRSLVFDHDLNFNNEYATFHVVILKEPKVTPLGLPFNKYPIGPALLWLPFFLLAHLLALLGQTLTPAIVADGYGYLYQAAICIGSIFYGSLGFFLIYFCARKSFSQTASLLAITFLWLASNAFYYLVFEPSMAHCLSLFSVSLFLTVWFNWFWEKPSPSLQQTIALGLAGGLIALVRFQDVIFLLLPYGYFLIRVVQAWQRRDLSQAKHWLLSSLVTGLSTLLAFLPQLLAWHLLFGTYFFSPYLSDHNPPFYWLQPHLWEVLFSPFHGLFLWHPIYFFALIGLLMLPKTFPRWLLWAFCALLLLNLYIIAAWWAWWQGDSFGGRMFLNAMWVWGIGLTSLLDKFWNRKSLQRIILSVGISLIFWNTLSLMQYRLGFVPMGKPLTWEQMTIERLKLPWLLIQKIHH